MRIGLVRDGAAGEHLNPFRRRPAASAGRTDDIGPFRLDLLLEEITHQTASLDGADDGSRSNA